MTIIKSLPPSLKIYAGLVLVLAILLAIVLAQDIEATLPASQSQLLTVPVLLVTSLLGAVGAILAERTGFPGIWEEDIPLKRKLLLPLVLGVAFGVGFVVLSLLDILPKPEKPAFPVSIPYFLYGGALTEILLRLFIMPLLVWLGSNLLLRGAAQEMMAWIATIFSSLLEPMAQLGAMALLGIDSAPRIMATLVLVFAVNLVIARLFRRAGFGAALIMRCAFYLVWHVVT